MTALPAAGYASDDARTGADMKTVVEAIIAVAKQQPGGSAEATLTIAAGVVTPVAGLHAIDTEAGAGTDDLTNIVTTKLPDGSMLLIRGVNAAHVVTVKHNAGGAGQVALSDAADLALPSTKMWLLLKRTGANWEEVIRFYGDQKAAMRTWLGLVAIAASGSASDLTAGTLPAGRFPVLTGDVTTAGGALATTIANNAVTNAKAAQMAANTIKGNNTGGSANAADLTVAQVKTLLALVAGDISGTAAVLNVINAFSKSQVGPTGALTDGASIAWDLDAVQNATITLGGAHTFAAPTNHKAGRKHEVLITTGGFNASWNANFIFEAAGAPDIHTFTKALVGFEDDGTNLRYLGFRGYAS
jgi:hypothetical protein